MKQQQHDGHITFSGVTKESSTCFSTCSFHPQLTSLRLFCFLHHAHRWQAVIAFSHCSSITRPPNQPPNNVALLKAPWPRHTRLPTRPHTMLRTTRISCPVLIVIFIAVNANPIYDCV